MLTAELTVNRRQADPTERQALATFRAGRVAESQELRDDAGWEHHYDDRDHAIEAMAAAVVGDISTCGAERVTALAVTHADCEDVADRIRHHLTDQGTVTGPAMEGPGWHGPRTYQAGDRILLHAHVNLGDGTRITNGTVATVTAVTDHGLWVISDKVAAAVPIPSVFVTGRGPDGRPLVSHAWARTIDGVQGGTWAQVHLLATPAVDRHRGYVGQSRSVQPTHTWNTTPNRDDSDHGGHIVKIESTTAEQVAAALARARPKVFAADTDPHRFERKIRSEQAAHRRHLEGRPPDVSDRLAKAEAEVAVRERNLADAQARVQRWETVRDATAGIRGFTSSRRAQHREALASIPSGNFWVGTYEREAAKARSDLESPQRQQADRVAFDRANQWRHDRIQQLEQTLNHHWTTAVLDAARDGYPNAYGPSRLKAARDDLINQVERLDQPHNGCPRVSDPLRALADLERAMREHPPAPPKNTHASHSHWQARGRGVQPRPTFPQPGAPPRTPAPPSRSIEL